MYERKQQKIVPASVFMRRMFVHILMAVFLSAVALFMRLSADVRRGKQITTLTKTGATPIGSIKTKTIKTALIAPC